MEVSSGKHRALLATLLLHANRPVATDYLISRVWDGDQPLDPRATLQTYIRRLRKTLGDDPGTLIRTRPDGYSIKLEPNQLDLSRFAWLLDQAAAATDPDKERALLTDALDLWRGPALADVPSERLRRDEVPRLTEQWLWARERLADLDLKEGRHADVIPELRQLTHEHPLRERAWGQLMTALYRSGRQAEALDTYRALAAQLSHEFGIRPSADLRMLHQRMLTTDPALRLPARRTEHRSASRPRQLPADVPGFTGRADQLKRLDALLSGHPAATAVVISAIAGTAGVGKTALAVHWARRVADRFPDGQLYLNLHGFATTPAIAATEALARLLRALGVAPEDTPTEVEEQAALYRSLLAGRSMLVVLDNAATAEHLRPLLPGEPSCFVLITSRNELRGLAVSHGATLLPLDVLTGAESHTLLHQLVGARRVSAEPAAAAELAELCGHLPLALRIAATNLAATPEQSLGRYVARLRAGDLLGQLAVAGDRRAAVRATFDLSYAALTPSERRMFRLLGVTPGSDITAPAAATLADTPPEEAGALLDGLARVSLIDRGPTGRFGMHDLLRRYAAEVCRSEEPHPEAATRRLLDFLLHTADAASQQLAPALYRLPRDPVDHAVRPLEFREPAAATAWLDQERDTLVATIRHAAEHGPRRYAWQLADSLRGYFYSRANLLDWQRTAEAGLRAAVEEQDATGQGTMRHSLGMLGWVRGAYGEAAREYRQAIECFARAGELLAEATSRNNLADVWREMGQVEQALTEFGAALDVARRLGDVRSQAVQLVNLGGASRQLGRLEEARAYLLQSLARFDEAGACRAQGPVLAELGLVHHDMGLLTEAIEQLNLALETDRLIGDRHYQPATLASLALVHCDAGQYREAEDRAREALVVARETDSRKSECDALIGLAGVQLRTGRWSEATAGYREALRLARRIDYRWPQPGALIGLAETHHNRGDHRTAAVCAAEALEIAERSGYAVYRGQALTALAKARLGAGLLPEAAETAEQALAVHRETGHRPGEARTLAALGHVMAQREDRQAAMAHWHEAHRLFSEMAMPEAGEPHTR